MKQNVKIYFDKEFALLENYKQAYTIKSSVYLMKKDKISGAIQLAQYLNLVSLAEVDTLYKRLHSN